MTNLTPITPKSAPLAIKDVLKARRVPFLKGSPGIGKSDIIRQVADDLNLKVIDIRLAQVDPTDLVGFPVRNPETNKMEYAPLGLIPLEHDPIPENYDGFLILFDEVTSAPPAVQAASYKIMLDRLVNQTPVHPNAYMAAAGNLDSDRAVTVRMSSALQSRFIHFRLETNLDEWLEGFAYPEGMDDRIISFLKFKPNLLHKFDPNSPEDTFPCPRTWEFTHDLISNFNEPIFSKPHHLITLAGTIGQGPAFEFKAAIEMFKECPTLSEIEQDPTSARVPTELSQLYSISTLLSSGATDQNISALIYYINRIPKENIEFQILTVRDIIRRKPALENSPELKTWMLDNAIEVFGA